MTETTPGPRVVEIAGEVASKNDEAIAPRVIETNDTRPIEVAEAAPSNLRPFPRLLPSRRLRPGVIAGMGIGTLAIGLIAIDTINWIAGQFEHDTVLGTLASAALAAGIGGVAYWLMAEVRGLQRLRGVERHRTELEDMSTISMSRAEWHIQDIVATIRPLGMENAISSFQDATQPHHSTVQRFELLSRIVIRPLDERAQETIRRAVMSTMGMSAVIPSALGDSVIFAARASHLIREVAEIYGHRPGLTGTMHLFKRVLFSAGTVGATDFARNAVGGIIAQHLGGAVIEKVADKVGTIAAESVLAGQRMARIGIFAMKSCRPLAFGKDEEPSVTRLVLG